MVHQHFKLADNLTVLENIILGAEPSRRRWPHRFRRRSRQHVRDHATDRHRSTRQMVESLGVGERQRVEIIKVLYRGANILILDEPTAVLVPDEVDERCSTLQRLVDDGATVIFISHKLDEVLSVSDDITVMRQGTTVRDMTNADIDRPRARRTDGGSNSPPGWPRHHRRRHRPGVPRHHGRRNEDGRPTVQNATLRSKNERSSVSPVSRATVRANLSPPSSVSPHRTAPSRSTVWTSPRISAADRYDAGLAYIPFDRHREGLMLTAPLWQNTLLGRDHEPELRNGPLVARPSRSRCV